MTKLLGLALIATLTLAACSSDNATHDGGIDGHRDSAGGGDAPTDSAADAPAGTFALTVKNYLSWCSVSVNGGTTSTMGMQTINVLPGTIPLTATAASSTFQIGTNMWHHTTGDTANTGETGTVSGSGVSAQSAATATVGSAAKCVWVCCPFVGGTGCDPGAIGEQCP